MDMTLVSRGLLSALFVAGGVGHFVAPAVYLKMMPPYIPWPEAMVAISGVAEFVLGALLWVPACQSLAAWGLIALLIAVFPANLHMALHPEAFPAIKQPFLWGRLPLQAAMIYWAYTFTG